MPVDILVHDAPHPDAALLVRHGVEALVQKLIVLRLQQADDVIDDARREHPVRS